jgi:hypothetical protein
MAYLTVSHWERSVFLPRFETRISQNQSDSQPLKPTCFHVNVSLILMLRNEVWCTWRFVSCMLTQVVTIPTLIREVPGADLVWNKNYPYWGSSWFYSAPSDRCQNRTMLNFSTTASSYILSFVLILPFQPLTPSYHCNCSLPLSISVACLFHFVHWNGTSKEKLVRTTDVTLTEVVRRGELLNTLVTCVGYNLSQICPLLFPL